eukprot:jgi/Chlat1/5019/Chrsp32S04989
MAGGGAGVHRQDSGLTQKRKEMVLTKEQAAKKKMPKGYALVPVPALVPSASAPDTPSSADEGADARRSRRVGLPSRLKDSAPMASGRASDTVDPPPAATPSAQAAANGVRGVKRKEVPAPPSVRLGDGGGAERMQVDQAHHAHPPEVNRKESRREKKRRLQEELEQLALLRAKIEDRQRELHANNGHADAVAVPLKPKRAEVSAGSSMQDAKKQRVETERCKAMSELLKSCARELTSLLKHRFAFIFNKPVDAEGLGLYDYHDIIKQPMDLGTIKRKLTEGKYKHPSEFAADMRLTFNNARSYNPVGHEVHNMAIEMSRKFEEKYRKVEAATEAEETKFRAMLEEQHEGPPVAAQQRHPPLDQVGKVHKEKVTGREVTHGREKDKAKERLKRPMTFDEKRVLSENMSNLPAEHLGHVVTIIQQRNKNLQQDGDEIELDIESLDNETLWQLDAYINSVLFGKLGKIASDRVQEALGDLENELQSPERPVRSTEVKPKTKNKRVVAEDDDVDIDDEGPSAPLPEIKVEQDRRLASGPQRSSSSTSSDSSSDSDSDTSSEGSDSGVERRSEGAGSKSSREKERTAGSNGEVGASGGMNAKVSHSFIAGGTADGKPVQPEIIKASAPKRELTLANAASWSMLANPAEKPKEAEIGTPVETAAASEEPLAPPTAEHVEGSAADPLWSEFQSKEQQQKQREKERLEEEERLRQSRLRKQEEADRKRVEARVAEQQRLLELAQAEAATKKKREEERAQAIARLQNMEQTVDMEEQRLLMTDFDRPGSRNKGLSAFGLKMRSDDEDYTNSPAVFNHSHQHMANEAAELGVTEDGSNAAASFGLRMKPVEEDDYDDGDDDDQEEGEVAAAADT